MHNASARKLTLQQVQVPSCLAHKNHLLLAILQPSSASSSKSVTLLIGALPLDTICITQVLLHSTTLHATTGRLHF